MFHLIKYTTIMVLHYRFTQHTKALRDFENITQPQSKYMARETCTF